ncbi:TonB-dependent siderophore receptor [Sphingomonas cavernae]|nr:TonB-dependent siderophore receptor [Sphingomonas cavernae]
MPKTTLKALFLASSAFAAHPAWAEERPATAPSPGQVIIVTGQNVETDAGTKTDTPLIETPQSISVITVDRFEAMGALNLQDTLRYSAGVRTEAYGLDTRGDYGFIRGTEAPIYQDGLRRTFGYRAGSKPEIFSLSRVEVLRGPSSMLYGQGSTGGILNIVTKRPEFETHGELFGSYGTFDRKELGFDLTGPIAGDQLAGRVIGVWRDSDSQTDFVREKRRMLGASLSWQMGEDTNLTLLGLVQDDDSGWTGQFLPFTGTLFDAPNGRLPWGRQLGEPSTDKVDLNTEWIAANFSHQFSHVVEFRQNFRYEWFRSDQYLHYADSYTNPVDPYLDAADPYLNIWFPDYAARGSGRVLNRYSFGEVFRSETLSSDSQLQFDFTTGNFTHKVLAGVDYARNNNRTTSTGGYSGLSFDIDGMPLLGLAPSTTPVDAYAPVYGNIVDTPFFDGERNIQQQLGVYLQSQTRAFDKAIVVLGIRRDRAEDRTVGGDKLVHKATTKRAGLMIELGDGFVPYLSYSESFLPIAGRDFTGNPFKPQRGVQYELGIKWQPDPTTFVTLAAYDLKDENRLQTDPTNPLNSVQTGVIKTQGFEIEASKTIADDFDVIATYSYTRAKDRSNGDLQVESVPKHLASIWGMKSLPLGDEVVLQLGAGVRYVDESISESQVGGFVVTSPDYVLADALIGVGRGPWTLTVNATNLFDKKYYTTCLGRGDCFLGLRRTVNATLGFSF